ncbi:MAG: hypothetical protein WCO16_01650 [bacterium]|jgi:asparagine N-glycosylation enzyme membrane subunit Stt3
MNNLELILPVVFIAVFAIIFILQRKNLKRQNTVDIAELRKTWALSMKNYVLYGTIIGLAITGFAFLFNGISLKVTVTLVGIIGLYSYINLRMSRSMLNELMENTIDLIKKDNEGNDNKYNE